MLVPVREAISSRKTTAVYIVVVLSAVMFAAACTVSLLPKWLNDAREIADGD